MTRRSRSLRPWALFVLLLLLAAACSSTSKKDDVTDTSQATASADAGATADASPGATAVASARVGPAAPGASEAPVPAGVRPAPVVAGGGPVRLGTGVTDKTIKIGINHSAPLGPAFQAVGFAGDPSVTDERRISEILIKYINAHGGLNGRKIIPVYNEYDAVGGGTWDSLAAEACQKFVNDEHVFAVLSGHVGQTDSLLACLAKGKTPLIQQNQWPYDAKYFNDFKDYLYQPSRMRPERFVPAYIKGLKDAGYFTPGAKLGLAKFDAPVFQRIAAMMRKELAKYGLKFTSEAELNTPQSVSDFGQMSSEYAAAVIRFRRAGVTHVMFDEYAGEMPFFGLTVAENQNYHPRYAFNSTNLPGTLQAQHDDSQLKNSVAISWLPGQDVYTDQDPRKGGVLDQCFKIVKAGGMQTSRLYDGIFCDSFFFLQKIMESTNNVTPAGMAAASAQLGTSYESPYTWTTKFGAGRTDGASSVRIAKYKSPPCLDETHGCYTYVGGNRPAG